MVLQDHPLATTADVCARDLADLTWIAGCAHGRADLMMLLRRWGFEPSGVLEADDSVVLLALVGAGLGVSLVPQLILSATKTPVASVALRPVFRRRIAVLKALGEQVGTKTSCGRVSMTRRLPAAPVQQVAVLLVGAQSARPGRATPPRPRCSAWSGPLSDGPTS